MKNTFSIAPKRWAGTAREKGIAAVVFVVVVVVVVVVGNRTGAGVVMLEAPFVGYRTRGSDTPCIGREGQTRHAKIT